MALLTFLSDFGLEDPYVGVVKAVLLGANPALTIVDLTHLIPPQDVRAGAFVLGSAYRDFPPGTIFLAVVDPGVGSGRCGLAAQTDSHVFVAPDNGLLTCVLRQSPASCYRLTEKGYFREQVSATFHARDIFAPVAAHLSLGVEPRLFGPPHPDPVRLPWPEPRVTPNGLLGEVIHVDRFGNLITNLEHVLIRRLLGREALAVEIAGIRLPVGLTYADATQGSLVGLLGSNGLIEIAVNCASAAAILGVAEGEAVLVH